MYFPLWLLLAYLANVHSQTLETTIWKETYTYQVTPTTCQCQGWKDFWQFWIGDPSRVVSITLGGSLTATTYKCSGSAAQFIATALAIPPISVASQNNQVTCESGIWYTGYLGSVSIGGKTFICDSVTPTMRPCWYNADFGGIGSAACAGPTQTFTVTVVTNVPVIYTGPTSVLWTDSYTTAVASTGTQCTKWRNFWQNSVPQSQSLSVSFRSSINGGVSSTTCAGTSVNLMAMGFFTLSTAGQIYCTDGSLWYFNAAPFTNFTGVQMGGPIGCVAGQLALRACWNQDWGGFGGVSCAAPSQTFTANVSIGSKIAFTNNCLKQLNPYLTTGNFTPSCSSTTLQCNSGYLASGFTTASGVYTCSTTTGVWVPKVPDCILITTTTTTSTTKTTTSTTSTSTTTTPTTTSTTTKSTTPTTSSTTTTTSTVTIPTSTSTVTTPTTSTSTVTIPTTTTTVTTPIASTSTVTIPTTTTTVTTPITSTSTVTTPTTSTSSSTVTIPATTTTTTTPVTTITASTSTIITIPTSTTVTTKTSTLSTATSPTTTPTVTTPTATNIQTSAIVTATVTTLPINAAPKSTFFVKDPEKNLLWWWPILMVVILMSVVIILICGWKIYVGKRGRQTTPTMTQVIPAMDQWQIPYRLY